VTERRDGRGRTAALAAAAVVFLLVPGCVSRSITVRSEPSGADAYLDDRYIGKTPVTVPFRHYGVRRIRVKKKGYRTTGKSVTIDPPWYQIMLLDLICEVLIPYKFEDKRVYSLQLEKPDMDKKGLMKRARREREFLE
jgi:hypothetical protein